MYISNNIRCDRATGLKILFKFRSDKSFFLFSTILNLYRNQIMIWASSSFLCLIIIHFVIIICRYHVEQDFRCFSSKSWDPILRKLVVYFDKTLGILIWILVTVVKKTTHLKKILFLKKCISATLWFNSFGGGYNFLI